MPPEPYIDPPDVPEQAESKAMTAAMEMSLNMVVFFHRAA